MNYNLFLNNNNKFKNHNRYKLTNKNKNSKIFLFSSVISIAVLTPLVILFTDSDSFATTHSSDASNITNVEKQLTSLELPEIGYKSQVLSKAVVYTEPETAPEIAPQQITALVSAAPVLNPTNEVAAETTTKLTELSESLVASHSSESDQENSQNISAEDTVFNIKTDLTQQSLDVTLQAVQTEPDMQNLSEQKSEADAPIETKTSITEISTEKATHETAQTDISQNNSSNIKTIVVKKGDTLSAIFKRHSLSSSTLYKIINSGQQAKSLTRIKPGQTFTIALDKHNNVESLKFSLNKVDTLIINKQDKQFISHVESKEIELRQQFATGTITNSLFATGQKAGLDSSMIMKLAQIFGWDIDFALDIRKGDSFALLYEEKYIDGEKFSSGNILSAEFINNGNVFKAIRYTDASGHTDYYSEKGLSMRKAFLRTPVQFSRISSRFSSGRKHPVLNRIRAHKGVDYAASRGTPIKAVGDGKVIFKGKKGGYGNVIILQHGAKYTTLYAHMKSYKRKLKHGSRIKQGQTIGYVGSSGLATGPHLHYEFRVNGAHRNPLTVALPSASPISKKYRADFNVAAETMISQLKLRKQETIALKD